MTASITALSANRIPNGDDQTQEETGGQLGYSSNIKGRDGNRSKPQEAKMEKASVSLTLKKSTKGTHVYENPDKGLNLYFPKELFGDSAEKPPATLKLTLEASK